MKRRVFNSRNFQFLWAAAAVLLLASPAAAQMDLRQVSGQPLPSPDVPVGTVTVRVIRGSLANNVVGQTVDVTVDGSKRSLTTDANGRVQVSGLKPGAQVRAVAVVDGERVESKDFAIGSTGIRVMLVAPDPNAAASAPGPAAAAPGAPTTPATPATPGTVVFGPESRVVAEMAEDHLNVYYLMDIVNGARTPVDIGGPLMLDLPREARAASLLPDSSKQGTVNGARVIVLGPFAPGATRVRVGFELPAAGGVAHISSKLPATLPQVIVIVAKVGGLDVTSPQISSKREVMDEGQRILVGTGPSLQAGQTLEVDITGVPHAALWPRYLALALAGSIMTTGIWAAVVASPRRRRS
jgi:hypothetical protein